MSDSFTEEMRAKLVALRDELESAAETGEQASRVVELDQSRMGRLSRMDALQAQAMSQASGRRREAKLRGITTALAKIDSGDYGYCQSCAEPINPQRLEIEPAALLCIDCAARAEPRD